MKIQLTDLQLNRVKGLYWVKRGPDKNNRKRNWEVGRWTGTHWNIPSCYGKLKNEELLAVVIEERLLTPEEKGNDKTNL